MIGFILGTSEGRKILSSICKYTNDVAVSTATSYGGELLKEFNIKVLNTKPLNREEMLSWMKLNDIHVLIDASHPYAQEVTKTALECTKELKVKYIRYERKGALENNQGEEIIRVENYDEAIDIIKSIEGNILNTTGGNNVSKFLDLNFKYRVIHRILPMPKVLNKIVEAGVSIKDIIALQGPISYELEKAFINQYSIKGILTKDSGEEGGVLEKLKAVRESKIKLIVIEKPKLKYDFEFNDVDKLSQYLVKEYKLKQLSMSYKIERTTTGSSDFKILEQKLDDELYQIYGEMQNIYSSHNTVSDLQTIIVYEDNNPVACGCLKILDTDLAEVKRVFVCQNNRGKGLSEIVVREIEKLAIERKIKTLILQTGSKQNAAINLYKKMGYTLIENYGPYVNDDNSICMKKLV
ncbi:cobalt-precorrin-6A reductase [Clostridium chromiireducens]|uniref:Cobalt-precorrin-6A reductase n=3 Tax=Clostridium chromiireducens TaxID=225345 RepID=A0A399IQ97_9CLOT|nr:cobalt-precorrin-6A reductase [Clostridium chromiireducens]RII35224.1 cobalt-precorrin-6A reductase [Clostridium chromiireducens]